MARSKLFGRPRTSILGGMIGSAALMSATLAQTPTIERTDAAGPPAILLHPAETTHRGGPGDFADLAQKVQAAVIGVTSKAMTRKTLPGQSFEFGTPEQEGRKDDAPPLDPSDVQQGSKTPELVAVGSGFFISADGFARDHQPSRGRQRRRRGPHQRRQILCGAGRGKGFAERSGVNQG
jgi:serine protease Do